MIALILSLIVLSHAVQAQSIDSTIPTVSFTDDTNIELSEGATAAITVSAAHLSGDTMFTLSSSNAEQLSLLPTDLILSPSTLTVSYTHLTLPTICSV